MCKWSNNATVLTFAILFEEHWKVTIASECMWAYIDFSIGNEGVMAVLCHIPLKIDENRPITEKTLQLTEKWTAIVTLLENGFEM